ncbi:hypothetical protein [Amycolatopsis echigonensis]|uniref:Uncharacterized protein n=1 Tax=Amycolatopsis echigonensis TaxID=2576905 RepID=A0A8E1W1R9_9PSEU|nr:hypothetical protein [Amycolatopsis echigonensis]MBB2502553.1 hypothetical protein [Amycolatopsis echigonensis]
MGDSPKPAPGSVLHPVADVSAAVRFLRHDVRSRRSGGGRHRRRSRAPFKVPEVSAALTARLRIGGLAAPG